MCGGAGHYYTDCPTAKILKKEFPKGPVRAYIDDKVAESVMAIK